MIHGDVPAVASLLKKLTLVASPDTIRKTTTFGLIGASGCLLGAVLGEPLFRLLPKLPGHPQVDVLFVLDATSSMQAQIDGVQRGIVDFARQLSERGLDERIGLVTFRDELEGEPTEAVSFGGTSFTEDYVMFSRQVQAIRAVGGGDVPESSYDALRFAAGQPFRDDATRVLLLITDAPPLLPDKQTSQMSEVIEDLRRRSVSQLHLVINQRDHNTYAPLQEHCSGEVFDLSAVAGSDSGFERLLPVLGERIAEATVRGLASSAAVGRSSIPRHLSITAAWTGLVACGAALSLIAGQNRYLRKPLLTLAQGTVGLAGGFLVGGLAGAVGQMLGFAPQFVDAGGDTTLTRGLNTSMTAAGILLGWALLGGLIGRGLAAFVPNLSSTPATKGGVFGGMAAAAGFWAMSSLVGDLPGRLLGATMLGFCIGAMIALIEAATRHFYLEVRYGLRELIRVSLGEKPVTVGGDGRICTVFAPASSRPIVFKYWMAGQSVQVLDYSSERVQTVGDGDERAVGTVLLTVRSGVTAVSDARPRLGRASATPPPPPPPPQLNRDRPRPLSPPPPPRPR
jgi:Ca-activated chloride channel family protein